jgi:DNA-binding transcriptional MerR regulator
MATDYPTIDDPFLSEEEAARTLNVKPRKLQYWRQEGGGPPIYKFNQAVRYRLSELLAWAAEQRQPSAA